MTRRKFVLKIIGAGSMIIAGASFYAKKASPLKFIRAFAVKGYPGLVKPMQKILKQGKWSG